MTQGTPPHPTIQDDGRYHTTATDLRFDVRYNVFNRRNLVITPFIGSVTPSHKYEYFAHAAPGRRVNELQVGSYIGTTLDGLLPGMFVQGRYGFGIQEQFLDITHNRSLFSGELGTSRRRTSASSAWCRGQVTHGGVDLSPTARLVWPAEKWQNHDRITRENFTTVGAGMGWTVNDVFDVFGSYTTMVQARNTHVLDRGHPLRREHPPAEVRARARHRQPERRQPHRAVRLPEGFGAEALDRFVDELRSARR